MSELAQAAEDGCVGDPKLLLLIPTLRLRRPELFLLAKAADA